MAQSKNEVGRMEDETGKGASRNAHRGFYSFILHPSSFILSLVSPKKLLNVWVLSLAQAFVGTAKNDVAFTHHHYFAVN
jgi:hypothetical protein